MNTIAGYKIIETVHDGIKTIVYRGINATKRKRAIIKSLKTEYPQLRDIARLKHEYKILTNLKLSGVIKPYDLEKFKNGLVLILEDFGGQSLKKLMTTKKLTLTEILPISIQVCETIGNLHQNDIIHKDIKPDNIIINPETGLVKIADFSISSQLERESQTIFNPNLLEGTLAYMSPEQTGRMNRDIDYRTDFYSFGVTLYEMLVGKLPFQSTDPMEMVHCHIAKIPPNPNDINPEIPSMISALVMKLLCKAPEDRYQSAYGLKVDLETCLHQLLSSEKISEFVLGRSDLSSQFQIPQKLYGRETEIASLMDAFERVSLGRSEVMLVAGYSGIGKSYLVNEIHKPIVKQRGYFISAKFEQFKRNIPYSSLLQAFQELIRYILTEKQSDIVVWKEKILEALGQQARVIIDVIPELELIIGEQPAVAKLGWGEAENRFNILFKKFLGVFTKKERPLVIFLDDLQWADAASLKLIHLLTTEVDSQYLLLIGAYRDNEVTASHPLILTLDEIKKTGVTVNTIILEPLQLADINHLIVDTLHCEVSTAKPLAELCIEKTQGNPFFLNQFLKSLYVERLLEFDLNSGCWEWSIEEIKKISFTDNVIDLMVAKLQKLPEDTQNLLKLAACIGNKFDLDMLSIVSEKSQSTTASILWPALQSGLILPLSDDYKIPLVLESEEEYTSSYYSKNEESVLRERRVSISNSQYSILYKFVHDRIHQSAYFLISESLQKETHLKIGRLLFKKTSVTEQSEIIFDIVNHLNLGLELINDSEEIYDLALLNLKAAKKAKASFAYETALRYFDITLKILPLDIWSVDYYSAFSLYRESSECEFLCGNFEQAELLFDATLIKAKSKLEKAEIYNIRLALYDRQGKYVQNLQTGSEALKLFEVNLPNTKQEIVTELEIELQAYRANVQEIIITDLANVPQMTDPDTIACMTLLMNMSGPAYFTDQDMYALITLKMVNLSIKKGNCEFSYYGYSNWGVILSSKYVDYNAAYQFGNLSLKIGEISSNSGLICKVLTGYGGGIGHWRRHIKENFPILDRGYKAGVETGDVYTSYIAFHAILQRITIGDELGNILQELNKYVAFLIQMKSQVFVEVQQMYRHFVFNLQGLTKNRFSLNDDEFDENQCIEKWKSIHFLPGVATYNVLKAQLLLLYEDEAQALAIASLNEENIVFVSGQVLQAEYYFYYSLILSAVYPSASTYKQRKYKKILLKNQERMKIWSDNCPENFLHKYLLIEAEIARIAGKNWLAADLYERAIESARDNEYTQNEALANELAAKFYLSKGKEKIAKLYISEARYGYIKWGATAKVKQLEEKYNGLLPKNSPENQTVIQGSVGINISTSSTTGSNSEVLDLMTVFKASQTLANEIILANLIDKLMKIVMENAGAETACLILEKDDKLVIKARASVLSNEVDIFQEMPPVESSLNLPVSALDYAVRTRSDVVLKNASKEKTFSDIYINKYKPKSILCTPIFHQGKLTCILYLENNLTAGAFTPERVQVLKLLSSQIAISLEKAILITNLSEATDSLRRANEQLEDYSRTLELKVQERTLELQIKEARLAEAQRLAHFGSWELNPITKEIIWSDETFRIFGLDPAQGVPNFSEHSKQIHPDDFDLWEKTLQRATETGEAYEFDLRILRPDGSVRHLFAKGQAILDVSGKVIKLFGTAQDITERKLAEQALRQSEAQLKEQAAQLEKALRDLQLTQAQLIQTEKMSSLGQLVAGVAHEINNPVNFIYGNLTYANEYIQQLLGLIELYQQAYPHPTEEIEAEIDAIELDFLREDLSKLLDSMRGGAERIRQIVLSLRSFSRLDESSMKQVDIHEGIESTLMLLQTRLRKEGRREAIAVIKEYVQLPKITCYAAELNQVFMNILSNAIDALESMREKEYSATPSIWIRTQLLDDLGVAIEITDNGHGMTEEVRSKVFDPFFTTKPVGSGTGLGLSVSYQIIVDKHGGKLNCVSVPGEGTTFTIVLPQSKSIAQNR